MTVNTYSYTIGTLTGGSNYTLTLAPETFAITPAAVTVTANAGQTKVFGQTDPTFTYTPTDITFTGSLDRVVGCINPCMSMA